MLDTAIALFLGLTFARGRSKRLTGTLLSAGIDWCGNEWKEGDLISIAETHSDGSFHRVRSLSTGNTITFGSAPWEIR